MMLHEAGPTGTRRRRTPRAGGLARPCVAVTVIVRAERDHRRPTYTFAKKYITTNAEPCEQQAFTGNAHALCVPYGGASGECRSPAARRQRAQRGSGRPWRRRLVAEVAALRCLPANLDKYEVQRKLLMLGGPFEMPLPFATAACAPDVLLTWLRGDAANASSRTRRMLLILYELALACS